MSNSVSDAATEHAAAGGDHVNAGGDHVNTGGDHMVSGKDEMIRKLADYMGEKMFCFLNLRPIFGHVEFKSQKKG